MPNRYQAGLHSLSDGSIFVLPGSIHFAMPGGLPAGLDIHTVDSVQRFPVGAKLIRGNKEYVYNKAAGTIAAGRVMQASVPIANWDNLSPTSASNVAAGSTVLTFPDPTTTVVANDFAQGEMRGEDELGEGYSYEVLKNDGVTGGGGGTWTVTIRNGLAIATGTAGQFSFLKSPAFDTIICPAGLTSQVVGISQAELADNEFSWMQTKGPASVLYEVTGGAAAVLGREVIPSPGTIGAVTMRYMTDGTPPVDDDWPGIGVVMDGAADAETAQIYLSGLL